MRYTPAKIHPRYIRYAKEVGIPPGKFIDFALTGVDLDIVAIQIRKQVMRL